jgi:hypothetical protein
MSIIQLTTLLVVSKATISCFYGKYPFMKELEDALLGFKTCCLCFEHCYCSASLCVLYLFLYLSDTDLLVIERRL